MSESVIIRPWDQTERELALLSAMNRRVHIHQFFDNNGPLGGKLGNEFPTLKPYQSDQDFFKRIWENLAQSFNRQSNASYIYTAGVYCSEYVAVACTGEGDKVLRRLTSKKVE